MIQPLDRVRIIGDPVLRMKSRPVVFPDDRLFLSTLLQTMREVLQAEEGLGLAAPQIGESIRLFLAIPDYLDELEGHTVFVNPVVEPYGSLEKREEGCLSVPGIWEMLERPSHVRITALDENGQEFKLDVEGLAARLFQHENDHLDGILFVDRLSPLKKKFLKRKLARLRDQGDQS